MADRCLHILSADLETRRIGSASNLAATDFCTRVIASAGFDAALTIRDMILALSCVEEESLWTFKSTRELSCRTGFLIDDVSLIWKQIKICTKSVIKNYPEIVYR